MKDFTKEELTVDDLKSMNPGVFAQGTCKNIPDDIFMVNSRIGDNMLWVAVRGIYHDWAIYIHWEENGIEYVKDFGDKVTNYNYIKRLVLATKDALNLYRI